MRPTVWLPAVAAVVLGVAGSAWAQTTPAPATTTTPPERVQGAPATAPTAMTPPPTTSSTNNAVPTTATNPNAPVSGANSFTEGEARARIERAGYSNVAGLKLDDKGVWRGTASKNGSSTPVALDYQGNVVSQ